MIRQVRGAVIAVESTSVVIDVGGWGVAVSVPVPAELKEGTDALLYTHLAVKQDGVELYGFSTPADLAFFELLLSVSGVGPKTALSILRRGTRESLETAIGGRDVAYLTRVVGLGKKAAEKLVVEIAEKIGAKASGAEAGEDAEVFDTLVALGYTEREARIAVAGIAKEIVGKDARLKAALSKSS